MSKITKTNTHNVDQAKASHNLLDRDNWYTNFAHYIRPDGELLFCVSDSRQIGRWFGYIFSFGISTVAGNRLSEMSIKVEGDDSEAIYQEFIDEYNRNQYSIIPSMIKNTIKRNNWYIVDYKENESLRVCSSGFRVHITMKKTT